MRFKRANDFMQMELLTCKARGTNATLYEGGGNPLSVSAMAAQLHMNVAVEM